MKERNTGEIQERIRENEYAKMRDKKENEFRFTKEKRKKEK